MRLPPGSGTSTVTRSKTSRERTRSIRLPFECKSALPGPWLLCRIVEFVNRAVVDGRLTVFKRPANYAGLVSVQRKLAIDAVVNGKLSLYADQTGVIRGTFEDREATVDDSPVDKLNDAAK